MRTTRSEQRSGGRLVWATGIAWFATAVLWTTSWSQSITWLGTLGGNGSRAYGVSTDGSVVVGQAQTANGEYHAFRWANGVMQDLGTLPGGTASLASGVSANGSVVVGWVWLDFPDYQYLAFRWTANGGMQSVSGGQAWGVSADGSVVVGLGGPRSFFHAFRWENGVFQDLGTLGGWNSAAYGVSANGSVVVGWAENASGRNRAFRWENGVMQDLGTLSGGGSAAYGVSAYGTVVVGESDGHAFRWVNGVMYDLGTLPGAGSSVAYGVSGNGVVVGRAQTANGGWRAFRWTFQSGMQDLNQLYAALLQDGSQLLEARAINLNGRYIVGQGYNATTGRYEAYLLDTWCVAHSGDVDNNGCVDDADLLRVLLAFGQTGGNLGRVDVNCDGTVDDADLSMVLFNYGQGC